MEKCDLREKRPLGSMCKEPLGDEERSSSSLMEEPEEREEWANKAEEFLSALGAVVGLGNIWRFPYITYQYGGGAFLIPYLVFVVLCGFPMFFLETSLGQFTRRGALGAWDIAPIMKGVGLGAGVITIFSSVYYITVMAWAVNYFVHTLRWTDLPWMRCDQWFNTNSCITYEQAMERNITGLKGDPNASLPIVEFWNNYVLRTADTGLDESVGGLENWPMILCMLVSWVMVYFCIFRGTKSTGKVIYFSSLFPFLTLLVLLVRGLTLEGASDGIKFYLEPNISELARAEVWVQAGSQVCYSYAICFAVLVAYGSFSKYNSDCYKRTFFLSVACSTTSFIGGFAVFAVLGNMAHVMDTEVSEVVRSGPGLAFITYPTALSMMPAPQLWNALFFFMLITLAIDSQFCCLEGGLVLVYDRFEWPRKNRELFVGIVCLSLFLFGLLFVTPGGVYIFEIFNNYAVGGISLLWLVTWQSIGVGWVYGARRYYHIINHMIGYYPSPYMSVCFCFVTPALTTSVLLFYMINYEPLMIGEYRYPLWANLLGWFLLMCSFLCVPGWALYEVFWRQQGTLIERLTAACQSRISVPDEIEQRFEVEIGMKKKPVEEQEMEVFLA